MSRIKVLRNPINKCINYINSLDLRKITTRLLILGIIFALAGAYLWYSRLYMTNERKFWLAIENSMTTKSVTRTIVSGGTGNQVVQDQRFFFSPQIGSKSKVSYNQKSATVDTAVVTEGMTFPDSQFSRYISFNTNQKDKEGNVPNLDEVLGKWEGNEIQESELDQAKQNYVGELVSLVIFGNYSPEFRDSLIAGLKESDAYQINNSSETEDAVDGKDAIIYQVSVELKSYAEQLQRAFVEAGYGEFEPLNPDNYQEGSKISMTLAVSSTSNTIIGVSFGDRQEQYGGYGINEVIEKPQAEFKPGELENFVQEELKGIIQ